MKVKVKIRWKIIGWKQTSSTAKTTYVIVIPRATLATLESMAAKVRKAKQGLPEPQAYEWVCLILAICKCFCEHLISRCTVYASVCALTPFLVDLVCVTDDPLWLLVLSLLSIQGSEGQRGPAGTRVSLLSVTASLLQFSYLDICKYLNHLFISFHTHLHQLRF